MNDERLGIVRLPWHGETIPLSFTWAAIDQLGSSGVAERLRLALTTEPGARLALAELLAAASHGALSTDAVMAEVGTPTEAFAAVLEAWALAVRRPAGARPANPQLPSPLKTWWATLWKKR